MGTSTAPIVSAHLRSLYFTIVRLERHSQRYSLLAKSDAASGYQSTATCSRPAVILLSKRWCIPISAKLEGPKLEPERPTAEVGFPTADQRFSSIQGTLFGFCGI